MIFLKTLIAFTRINLGFIKMASIILRILLAVLFYLLVTPCGMVLRLFKIDVIEKNCKPAADSYWRASGK